MEKCKCDKNFPSGFDYCVYIYISCIFKLNAPDGRHSESAFETCSIVHSCFQFLDLFVDINTFCWVKNDQSAHLIFFFF